jgi:hypothetical protein
MRAVVLVGLGALVGSLCAARPAGAQTTTASAPFIVTPPGDQGGDAGVFSGFRLSAPLRLSLEASVAPKAGGFPNCDVLGDDVGNSVGGIPVQHYTELRLTPRLVLSFFTQLGCPIDAGLGAALTYAIPVRDSMQVVFGAGMYGAPAQFQLFGGLPASFLGGLASTPSPLNEAARVDMVWSARRGNTYDVGVESVGTRMQGVRFGGGF